MIEEGLVEILSLFFCLFIFVSGVLYLYVKCGDPEVKLKSNLLGMNL